MAKFWRTGYFPRLTFMRSLFLFLSVVFGLQCSLVFGAGNPTFDGLTVTGTVDFTTATQFGIIDGVARTAAGVAQSTANSAITTASTAQTTANIASSNAATAQSTANSAVSNASFALGIAQSGTTQAHAAQVTANAAIPTASGTGINTTVSGTLTVVTGTNLVTVTGTSVKINGVDVGGNPFDQSLNAGENVTFGIITGALVGNADTATNANFSNHTGSVDLGDFFSDVGLGNVVPGYVQNATNATNATSDQNGHVIGSGDYTGLGGTIDNAGFAWDAGFATHATYDANGVQIGGGDYTGFGGIIDFANRAIIADSSGVSSIATFFNDTSASILDGMDGSGLSGVIHTLASGSNVIVTSGTVSVTGLASGTLSKLTIVTGTINLTNGVISGGLFSGGTLNNVTIGGVTTVSGTVSGNIVRSGTTTGGVFSSGTFGGDGSGFTNLPMQLYSGSFSGVGTATTAFTVTIGTTQANTNYKVNVTPTAALSAALFYISAKTTTTFTVTYLAGLTGTVTFDWSVFP